LLQKGEASCVYDWQSSHVSTWRNKSDSTITVVGLLLRKDKSMYLLLNTVSLCGHLFEELAISFLKDFGGELQLSVFKASSSSVGYNYGGGGGGSNSLSW
jgi:hypothetical protein